MGSIDLREDDIIAFPAVRRLDKAFEQLKALAVRETTRALVSANDGLCLSPCGDGNSRGYCRPPWFYGELITPAGVKYNDVNFVAWAGVRTAEVDWIEPLDADVPELTVGLAVWCECPSFEGPDVTELDTFEEIVSAISPGPWEWQRIGRPGVGPVMIFSVRVPFTKVLTQVHCSGWDDWASSFYRVNLKALIEALKAPCGDKNYSQVFEGWAFQSKNTIRD